MLLANHAFTRFVLGLVAVAILCIKYELLDVLIWYSTQKGGIVLAGLSADGLAKVGDTRTKMADAVMFVSACKSATYPSQSLFFLDLTETPGRNFKNIQGLESFSNFSVTFESMNS